MICIYQVLPEACQQKSGPSDQFRTYSGPLLALRPGSGPSPEFRTLVVPLHFDSYLRRNVDEPLVDEEAHIPVQELRHILENLPAGDITMW